jgi:hypothetical protein
LPPPVNPLEAKRVWDHQRRPSSRTVAKALTRAGRPVHFTTIARWRKREWQVQPRLEHPLAVVMRKVDLFVPLLTGDPTSKAADIVGGIFGAASSRSMTSDQDLDQVIRQSCITSIILPRLLLQKLIALKPLDIAEFGKTKHFLPPRKLGCSRKLSSAPKTRRGRDDSPRNQRTRCRNGPAPIER